METVEVDSCCAACGHVAVLRFADDGARLSLLYWTCVTCDEGNADAFDWLLDETVACDVGRMKRGNKWEPI